MRVRLRVLAGVLGAAGFLSVAAVSSAPAQATASAATTGTGAPAQPASAQPASAQPAPAQPAPAQPAPAQPTPAQPAPAPVAPPLSAAALKALVPSLAAAPPLAATASPAAAAAAAPPFAAPGPLSAAPAPQPPRQAAAPAPVVAARPAPLTLDPAAPAAPNEIRITGMGSSSAPWSIVLLLTGLTLIPSLLICVTPFARLLVVFHFLRQALGLQTTPSNQTLIGLTLVMTFFIMEPVGNRIYQQSFVPLEAGKITAFEAISRSAGPMREFMSHYVREKDAALFLEIAKEPRPRTINDLSMRVLLPAYIVSELKAGFQIGAVLFLPFLVVDMVVASITTSVGMMQLPPVVISTPLKLLLFLMVDGWHLLISSLMRSFS